tara:strand:+ start:8683 stop:8934 length:252 start_codon:yes stop_codon:yes gene_type:complete
MTPLQKQVVSQLAVNVANDLSWVPDEKDRQKVCDWFHERIVSLVPTLEPQYREHLLQQNHDTVAGIVLTIQDKGEFSFLDNKK